MAAIRRTASWALVTIAALLLTACNSITAELDKPISAPTRTAPLLSIHNPLVVQTGDTVTSSGGPLHDWPPGVEVEKHGLRIFHPYEWFFASSQEELLALRPQLGDAATAAAFLEERDELLRIAGTGGAGAPLGRYGFPQPELLVGRHQWLSSPCRPQ